MPNPRDDARMEDRNAGANVVDLDAYRNASIAAGNTSTSQSYIPPHAWTWALILIAICAILFVFKRR